MYNTHHPNIPPLRHLDFRLRKSRKRLDKDSRLS